MFLCSVLFYFLIHNKICNIKKHVHLCLNSQLFFLFLDSDSQLLVYNPNIYSCSIPAIFHQELVHMPQLCTGSSSSKIPHRHLTTLQSARGQKFLHFAKSDSFLDGMKDHDPTICNSAVGLTLDCIAEIFSLCRGREVEEREEKEGKGKEKLDQFNRQSISQSASQGPVKTPASLGTGPQLSPSFSIP